MKRIIIVALATLYLSCGAQTVQQERKAERVIKAFIAGKYPTAKSRMILEEYRSYRAVFKMDGHRYTSKFSINGDWLQTEKHLRIADMDANVKQSLEGTEYKNCKVCSVVEMLFPKKPDTVYMIEVRKEIPNDDPDPYMYSTIIRQYHKLYFTASGSLVKDELEPDDSLPFIPWGQD